MVRVTEHSSRSAWILWCKLSWGYGAIDRPLGGRAVKGVCVCAHASEGDVCGKFQVLDLCSDERGAGGTCVRDMCLAEHVFFTLFYACYFPASDIYQPCLSVYSLCIYIYFSRV